MSVQLHPDAVHTEPEFVQFEVADQVATIWLNRPEVRNCVNWALLEQFGAALDRAERDPNVTMRITKLAANRGLDGDAETLLALESMTCNVAHQSNDAREGVQAFLQKRDSVWTHS